MNEPSRHCAASSDKTRWHALLVTCLGVLMTVLDSTIVNVALPSMGLEFGLSENSLAWIINGYVVPYGGCLLLCGRLGDYYGHRRLFLFGVALFTTASLGCGIAWTAAVLFTARAVQGVGAAAVAAVSYSLIMKEFEKTSERAQAMGILSFVGASGGSAGLLLGGLLTSKLNWRWTFLVNIPIGAVVCALQLILKFRPDSGRRNERLDVWGAVIITTALTLAAFSILRGTTNGWGTANTLFPMFGTLAFILLFIYIESREPAPIVPMSLFRNRNLALGVVIGALWGAAQFAWFFISTLYLQLILGYDALEVGLAFLPATVAIAALSLGLSKRLVVSFGTRLPFAVGLLFVTAGLILFARTPVHANFSSDVLPAMLLLGLGCGIGYGPFLLGALRSVSENDYGVASGIINSSSSMGGVLALAVLAAIVSASTNHLLKATASSLAALNGGYHTAFAIGAVFAAMAGVLGTALLLSGKQTDVKSEHTPSPALRLLEQMAYRDQGSASRLLDSRKVTSTIEQRADNEA